MENELTLEKLLTFLNIKYRDYLNETLTLNSKIRCDLKFCIDGDDAKELLDDLEKTFKVNFGDNFFEQYFLTEIEISKNFLWFGLKKRRKIKNELSIIELFNYMKMSKR